MQRTGHTREYWERQTTATMFWFAQGNRRFGRLSSGTIAQSDIRSSDYDAVVRLCDDEEGRMTTRHRMTVCFVEWKDGTGI